MTVIQGFLDKAGGTFQISALVPSLGFVTIAFIVFRPILPKGVIRSFGGDWEIFGEAGLSALLITLILAFTLNSLSTFILKVLEGYILIQRLKFLKRGEIRRFHRMQAKLRNIEKRLARLSKKNNPYFQRQKNALEMERHDLKSELEYSFPGEKSDLLPTRFGNTLKAAEAYPMQRYKIDSVPIWTRLIHVIPLSYELRIDQSYNQLCFLVNCSLLSIIFAFASLFAAIYQFLLFTIKIADARPGWLPYFITLGYKPFIYEQRTWIYLAIVLAAVIMGMVFYRAALVSVLEFGEMIRSAYDLFRLDLIQALHLPLPVDSKAERNIWTRIVDLINVGYRPELDALVYQHPAVNVSEKSTSEAAPKDEITDNNAK